jgi:Pretoxin HINT domain
VQSLSFMFQILHVPLICLVLACTTSASATATRAHSSYNIEIQPKKHIISDDCQSVSFNAASVQLAIAKDCAVDCLLSMLPIPDPCGRFGKLFGAAIGIGAGLANSFEQDTLVHTRILTDSGYQSKLKPIKDIAVGDEVLAWDELQAHDNMALAAAGQAASTLQAAYSAHNPNHAHSTQNSLLEANLAVKTASSPSKCCSRSYENNSTVKDLSKPPSAQRYEKVTDIASSFKAQTLLHLTLDNGQTIQATAGHPFKTSEGWRDAVMLKKGGKLLLRGGDAEADANSDANGAERYATITDIREEVKTTAVFNLEVANLHTFFVGEEGLVVHNGHGAYEITYPDGSSYFGKGDESRMNKSAKQHGKGGARGAPKCSHFPAASDVESFILEHNMLTAAGGPKGNDGKVLNKINSPGKRMSGW